MATGLRGHDPYATARGSGRACPRYEARPSNESLRELTVSLPTLIISGTEDRIVDQHL